VKESAARGAPPEPHDRSAAGQERHPSTAPATAITPATPSTAGPLAPTPAATSGDAGQPVAKPSYTARLLADRNLRLKKLGEEAAELVLACADHDQARAAEEGADLVYHTLVALHAVGVTLDDVRRVLAARAAPVPGR
jgi:phosphoribosyl-ATP pyrophosphohydrolase/phosphoribosyl-AMP cyclohydrolase